MLHALLMLFLSPKTHALGANKGENSMCVLLEGVSDFCFLELEVSQSLSGYVGYTPQQSISLSLFLSPSLTSFELNGGLSQ